MHSPRWRAQAERLFALAQEAGRQGKFAWAERLTARATRYLDKAVALEASQSPQPRREQNGDPQGKS